MSEDDAERELPFGLNEIDALECNAVWKEIIATVKQRIQISEGELRIYEDITKIMKVQGDLIACEFFLLQPEALRMAIEERKEEQLKESSDG